MQSKIPPSDLLRRHGRRLKHIAALLLAIAALLPGTRASADEAAVIDYGRQVAPILRKYCAGCHNPQDHEGKLTLQSYAGAIAGGENGLVIIAGKSQESRLVLSLTGKVEPAMPPEGNEKPTNAEVALLAAWIDQGAKGPVAGEEPPEISTPKIKPTAPVREAVTSIAYAPDGMTLAVARYDAVEILTLPQRSRLRLLGPHRGRVNAVAFSRDGKQVLAAAGEPGVFGEVRLWNLADGSLARVITGHQDSLYAAVISPDGALLATSGYDQQIKLWNVATGQELRTLAGHNDAVFDLAFRPDGKILASASGDRTVKLWSIATGERQETFGQPLKEQYAVAFSPDGRRVAAGGADNRIRVWQVSAEAKENTNPIVYSRFAHEGAVAKLAFTADGKTLVSAGEDRTIKIWEAESLTERQELERQSDWAPALAISPDGKHLAVGRLDGTVAFYDLANGSLVPPPPPAKPELARLSISGVMIGATGALDLFGKHLADVTAIKTSDARITARLLKTLSAEQLQVEVTTAAELDPGRYELWVEGPGGASVHQALHLDTLAQTSEIEPNNLVQQATRLSLPGGVWGVLSAKGDVDHFAMDAKAGQKLTFELVAAAIGSKLNARLTLFDATGRVIADHDEFGATGDPLLTFVVPSDGRYVVQVADLMLSGSDAHFYRLSVGELAIPTGVFPLGVVAGQPSSVHVTGFNLPADLVVQLPAAPGGELDVPLARKQYRVQRPLKVTVGSLAEVLEAEPNDQAAQATAMVVPGTANGRIIQASAHSPDFDCYRFDSQAGQTWIIETEAARRGSPVDTVIEVLTADGKPIERLLLQAVRDSYITFRGIDGNTRDCRVANWEEMQLNQWLYLNGEVVKLFRSPQGPDSGFLFYEGDGGRRQCYFDTTATVHAVDEPCYIIEPHAPGSKLIASGLPVFPLYYSNDDDGQRRLGRDSRVTFTAPAAGSYVVRVRDARGASGSRFAYRLTVRQPQPDFRVSLAGGQPTVDAGSGKRFSVVVDRVDDFDGEVQVDIAGLPAGFHASTPLTIQAGHREAKGVLLADADAKQPTDEELAKIRIEAKARLGNAEAVRPVAGFGKITLGKPPKIKVRLEPAEIVIAPGQTVPAMLKVERNGHDDLVTFAVENLPHGVIVDNIGLNGVLLPKGETERQIFITADAWVPAAQRLCFAIENQAGGQCSAPVMVHIRPPAPLAKATASP